MTMHLSCAYLVESLRRVAATLLVTAAFVSATSMASAQDDAYLGHVERALAHYDAGRYDDAIDEFERAHAIRPSARTLRGMGLAHYQAGDHDDAVRYLSQAVESQVNPLTDHQRAEAGDFIRRANERRSQRSQQTLPWYILGSGFAAAGGGSAFWLVRTQRRVSSCGGDPNEGCSNLSTLRRNRNFAAASTAVSLGLSAAAFVIALTRSPSAAAESAGVQSELHVGSDGIRYQLSF